ncbi:putative Na(+) H(+) antiporter subunit E [hydrothermal vent metagenome]|uniref:Putative Na(+) H(+) antiporter subunit E n=1 Tax=hydrothermal vent metagenome TaxID=652676 RepID=A0A1W1BD27_9ZZZZ
MLGKFILLFLVWIGLTNSLDIQELIVGAIVAFVVARFFTPNREFDLKLLAIKYIKFIPLFFKSLIQSNIEVAKIVLNPKLPINTGIVKLKTTLKGDSDKLILANAITLTPGTITIELDKNDLYIHVLNIEDENRDVLQGEIVDVLEKGIIA